MDDIYRVAGGARVGNLGLVAADVTTEAESVGVESQGEETVGAESLPAARFTEGERGGAAAVVENQGLVVVFEVFSNFS